MGGCSCGGDTPESPDYAGLAEQQAQGSREVTEQQTWANRPDQVTPYGSQTWQNQPQWDPSTNQYLNRWQQTTTLTPDSQAALDSQLAVTRDRSQLAQDMTGRLQSEMGNPMNWDSAPDMGAAVRGTDISARNLQTGVGTEGLPGLDSTQKYYGTAGDAIYNQWADRAMPEQARQTEALDAQLYNRGLRPGDEAYNRELEKLRQTQGDAQRQASYQATIGAGSEAERMLGMDSTARGQLFGEGLQNAGLNNSAQQGMFNMDQVASNQNFGQNMSSSQYDTQRRQQVLAEEMQRRGFTLNEINAAMSGQQVAMPSMPGFTPASRAEGVQSLAAGQMQGQADLDAYNAKAGATTGLLSGLASSALGAYSMGMFGGGK
jgi:hypothetical protein